MFESLNGRAVSWSEISITANVAGGMALPVIEIKSIDHESKVDRGDQRGASGGRVLKRTSGALTNSASAEFYKDGLRTLKKALAAVGFMNINNNGHMQLSKVSFDIVITHSWDDDPEIYCTKLIQCHLDKDAGKHAEGTDPETVSVDLNPIQIVEIVNGIPMELL